MLAETVLQSNSASIGTHIIFLRVATSFRFQTETENFTLFSFRIEPKKNLNETGAPCRVSRSLSVNGTNAARFRFASKRTNISETGVPQ
jgi:hypothetical protein